MIDEEEDEEALQIESGKNSHEDDKK